MLYSKTLNYPNYKDRDSNHKMGMRPHTVFHIDRS